MIFSFYSESQIWIDSIKQVQENLDEPIEIISFVRFYSAGCELINSEVYVNEPENKIDVINCYGVGPLDTICPSVDTIILPNLSPGEYQLDLIVNVYESSSPNLNCNNFLYSDTSGVNVIVEDVNSIQHKNEYYFTIKLVQNPVYELIDFQIQVKNAGNYWINIYDSLGRRIKTEKLNLQSNSNNSIQVNFKEFVSGIYYYNLESRSRITEVEKFIKF